MNRNASGGNHNINLISCIWLMSRRDKYKRDWNEVGNISIISIWNIVNGYVNFLFTVSHQAFLFLGLRIKMDLLTAFLYLKQLPDATCNSRVRAKLKKMSCYQVDKLSLLILFHLPFTDYSSALFSLIFWLFSLNFLPELF